MAQTLKQRTSSFIKFFDRRLYINVCTRQIVSFITLKVPQTVNGKQTVWREWRSKLGSVGGSIGGDEGPASPPSRFDDINLSGRTPLYRRQSMAGPNDSSFQNVLSRESSAFTDTIKRDILKSSRLKMTLMRTRLH